MKEKIERRKKELKAYFDNLVENVFDYENDSPAVHSVHVAPRGIPEEQFVEKLSLNHIESILQCIGEDADREGLVDTPRRVVKSWKEIYKGYAQDPKDVLTIFEADGADQMILLKDIELYSMCEHHMLPFYGKAHVAYIPDPKGKIIGVSKLARLVDIYARRLQIQERIGDQVTDFLMKELGCLGAACIIDATHMCMRMRGVNKQNSSMLTSSMRGVFKENLVTRQELLNLIQLQ